MTPYKAGDPRLSAAHKTRDVMDLLPFMHADRSIVYFVRRASDGAIKIGRTGSFRIRYRDLRTTAKEHLEVLYFGEDLTERPVLKAFAHLCIGGEWHIPADDLVEFILDLRRKDPSFDAADFPTDLAFSAPLLFTTRNRVA